MRIALLFHLVLLTASGAIHQVPSDYSTIQEGIVFSTDGDTVLVANGRYFESINFYGKAITITSNFMFSADEEDIRSTIIDASLNAGALYNSVVTFMTEEDSSSILMGFTITGGTATYFEGQYDGLTDFLGGGILCIGASPTLASLIITNNSAQRVGGGVFLYESNPTLVGLEIRENTAVYGAGISMHASSPTISMSVIADNIAGINSGGIDVAYGSSVVLDHLTVAGNRTLGQGLSGGLGLYESSTVEASNSIFFGNLPEEVDFVSFGSANTASFQYCLVQGGEAGIYEWGQTLNWGAGNLDEDPQFCDSWDQNYSLSASSPCIGAGSDGSLIGALDLGCETLVPSDTTIGHWPMDQSLDSTIQDMSGNGIDGISNGGEWSTGLYGDAMHLDSTGYVWVPYHPYLMVEDAMTIEAICLFDSLDRDQMIISRSTSSGFSLSINTSNHLVGSVWTNFGLVSIEAPSIELVSNTWYHFALSVSPSIVLLYIDHVLIAGYPITGPIFYNGATALCIGGMISEEDSTLAQGFLGSIDEVRLSNLNLSSDRFLTFDPVSVENAYQPTRMVMKQNFPNPFNPSTTIRYGVPEDSNVSLVIYDVRGQVVQTLESSYQSAGWYEVIWNGETVDGHSSSTGIYFAKLVAGDFSEVIKMVYQK